MRDITWHAGEVSYEERCRILGQPGLVVWFTGLSGAGKSTIAAAVEKALAALGRAAYRLDGDNIRHGLNSDLGFSEADRHENIRRIAEVAALFKDAGLIVLVSCISPYAKMRRFAREKAGGNFMEVYVKADLRTCAARDPKGIYRKAMNGEIADFTGVSAPYEEPVDPELTVDTTLLSIEEAANTVLNGILNMVKHYTNNL